MFPAERPRPGASWAGRFLRLPPLPDLPPAKQEVQGHFQEVYFIGPIVWNLPAGFLGFARICKQFCVFGLFDLQIYLSGHSL